MAGGVPAGATLPRQPPTCEVLLWCLCLVSRFATAVVQLDMQRAEHTSLMTLVGGLQVVQPA